jgi:hypothetical protein
MFEFDTYNNMATFILRDDINEDPGSHCIDPGCDRVFMSFTDTYIHCVCLMTMSEFEFFKSIDPQCMFSVHESLNTYD